MPVPRKIHSNNSSPESRITPRTTNGPAFVNSVHKHHADDGTNEVKEISRMERWIRVKPLEKYLYARPAPRITCVESFTKSDSDKAILSNSVLLRAPVLERIDCSFPSPDFSVDEARKILSHRLSDYSPMPGAYLQQLKIPHIDFHPVTVPLSGTRSSHLHQGMWIATLMSCICVRTYGCHINYFAPHTIYIVFNQEFFMQVWEYFFLMINLVHDWILSPAVVWFASRVKFERAPIQKRC